MEMRYSQYPTRRSGRKVEQAKGEAPKKEIDLLIGRLKTRDGRAIAKGRAALRGLKPVSGFGKEELREIVRVMANRGCEDEAVDLLLASKNTGRALELCEANGSLSIKGAEIARSIGDSKRVALFAGRAITQAGAERRFDQVRIIGAEYRLFEMALSKLAEFDAYGFGYRFALQHLGQERADAFINEMIDSYKNAGRVRELNELAMRSAQIALAEKHDLRAVDVLERGLMFEHAGQLAQEDDPKRANELYEKAVQKSLALNNPENAVRIKILFQKDVKKALELCQDNGLYELGLSISEEAKEHRWALWMRERAIEAKIKEGDISGANSLMKSDKRLIERAAHFCEANGRLDLLGELLEERGDREGSNGIASLERLLRDPER